MINEPLFSPHVLPIQILEQSSYICIFYEEEDINIGDELPK